MNQLLEEIEGLSPKQRLLLDLLQKEEAQTGADVEERSAIPSRLPDDEPQLSFGQKRLWFVEQLQPGNAAYNVPGAVRIEGKLDVGALTRCLDEVARQHEILRTRFPSKAGSPLLVIDPQPRLALEQIDFCRVPAVRREGLLEKAVGFEIERPFDLSRGPLARTVLFRLDQDSCVFLLVMHHIICDIWSVGVFFRNMMALYDDLSAGRRPSLPPLPVQYADYALWQNRRLSGNRLDQLLDFWKGRLTDVPLVVDLPIDHARPAMQSMRGGRSYFQLGSRLTRKLKEVGRLQEASLYMGLLAALDILLYRLTGQTALLVGVPMANRSKIELEGLIGILFNQLVIRADMGRNLTFRQLLGQVRERMLDAFAHQDLPFEQLVDELKVERDMSRNPIFQVLFAFQNVPPTAMGMRGLKISRYEVLEKTSREDLELDLRETPEGLAGWFGYDEGLFEKATIDRWAQHFQLLLECIVEDPDRRISEIPLLTPAQRHQLLTEWNDTGAVFEDGVPFSRLFEAQAERRRDAAAAVFEGHAASYGRLNAQANRLARRLAGQGVGADSLVGLLADRSTDFLTVVLAVWKAGGAYLPLDPNHPARRHAQVLSQSAAALIIADDQFHPVLAEAGAGLESLQARPASLSRWLAAEGDGDDLPLRCAPSNLAYTIFTSGSTGLPKGAMVEHKGMVNHLWAKVEELGIGPSDRVAQNASQCFDISVWQFMSPLLVGGQVHIYGDEIAHDPARLLERVEEDGITILEAVPSVLRLVLDEAGRLGARRPSLRALRSVVPTGEALPPELCRQWLQAYPAIPLVNAYGPTECSDDVTHHRVSRPPRLRTARVPIGRAVPNLRLNVLDREFGMLPIGAAGELCVSGVGVGRGYLNNPPGTAAAFAPDRLSRTPGSRLYRTGDLARRLPDGLLDFLGRIDHQVKVRGFRIELGEIETAILRHASVREAAVVVCRPGSAAAALVAYLTSSGQNGLDERQLADSLKEQLPEYMLPAAFRLLDSLPLTPNGKVDRNKLAAQQGPEAGRPKEHLPPRTPTEEALAGIWQQVLKAERVGANDHFFEAGGQSLLATQVISRIREAFQVELPVRAAFQYPVLSEMAAAVDEAVALGAGQTPLPAIRPVPRDGDLPLSYSQERLWFIDRLIPGTTAYNIFGAVRLKGKLKRKVLERCFDELLRRHEVLRTTFRAVEGEPVQVIAAEARFSLPLADLRGLVLPFAQRETAARQLGNREAQKPFDLANGPLIRGLLVRIGDEDHLLAVTAHHVVYDVWSRELLIRELGVLYEAFWHGRPSPLPELPVQYADFAHWQRRYMRGEALEQQLSYWKKQLAGVEAGSQLPGDRPRPPQQSYRGARVWMHLPAQAADGLKSLSRRQGVTLFMTLLAGFKALLARYCGEDDAVVGSPIANRNRAETDGLIGFFVNTQVLRTNAGGDPAFQTLLQRVRETALGAYSHQDLAFEQLVNQLQPRRDTSRQPLFQILFNFLTNYKPILMELPNLALTPEANHSGAVQFDLILSMYEDSGQLHFAADYSTDLYDRTTILRILGHYGMLLEEAAAHPSRRISELSLCGPAQRQQILWEWNDTQQDLPAESDVLSMFGRQSAQRSDQVAVACGGGQLSYGELERRAAGLAECLRSAGAGPETTAGVHLRQDEAMVTALFAVLQAGAAYLPLDPSYPPQRLADMLQDSGAALLVTQSGLSGKLAGAGVRELLIDAAIGNGGPAPTAARPAGPDDLAYLIYTSGSSGRPKGVQVSRRSLAHSTWARCRVYGRQAGTFLLLSSFAFDSSVAGIFGTLCRGGRLVLPSQGLRQDISRIGGLIREQGVTQLLAVPSLYGLFVDQPETAALRDALVAGEACPAELVQRHWRCCPATRLWNEYGPTEGTVWASVEALGREAAQGRVPIGRPIPNVRLEVLDRQGCPLPAGALGELCIGGLGVARGYHGRPALTAERFVPDPLGGRPGARLYRSGDLARRLPSGVVEFLGRIDQQVKIHGFRVEPEEIEAVLCAHRAVAEAAVVVRRAGGPGSQEGSAGHAPADSSLAAWIVLRQGEPEPQLQALRSFLKQRLPEHMVPSSFSVIDALPLTPNGKVDRKALSAAQGSRLTPQVPYAPPRTEVEVKLAEIWADLLGVERVGLYDNFFDLGGHSLLTTRLVSRLRDAFGIEVPLQFFFEEPTLTGLAEGVELSRWTGELAQAPPDAGGEGLEEGEI